MSQHILIAFIVFAVVALYTPGPNNVMLMTSGLNFGFRRTLPHVAGVAIGYAFLVGVIGFGLGAVFEAWPMLQTVLKYAGCAYLVYLAIAIALSGPADAERAAEGRPLSFLGAALFQWINVKGWVIAIGTITAYAAVANYPWNIMILTALLLVLGFSSSMAWALFGTWLKPIVTSPRAVRVFNAAMALLLLASLYPVLTEA